MKKILQVFGVVLLFVLLTALTQVGGVILLLWMLFFRKVKQKITTRSMKSIFNIVGFMLFYMIFNLVFVPFIARQFDRVPLPYRSSGNLVPVTRWTCILNRHYICTNGREELLVQANALAKAHPGAKIVYMDCNYPFRFVNSHDPNEHGVPIIEGLFPHFTHIGNKADIAFIYRDENREITYSTRTAIGYGSSEEPEENETCVPCECDKKYPFYSIMHRVLPKNKSIFFDETLTASLIKQFQRSKNCGGILLEKHLRQRLDLLSDYRYGSHGCRSVRHDDHFHVRFE